MIRLITAIFTNPDWKLIKTGQVEQWLEFNGFELLSLGEDLFQDRLGLEDVIDHRAVSISEAGFLIF